MCKISTELALAFLLGDPVSNRFNFVVMLTLYNHLVGNRGSDVINPAFAVKVCKQYIFESVPPLQEADIGELQAMLALGWSDREACNIWLAEQVLRFGAVVEIPPLPERTVAFLTKKPSKFEGISSGVTVLQFRA